MRLPRLFFINLFIILICTTIQAQTPAKVYYYTIDDNIAKPMQRKTEKAVKDAEAMKADYLFLEINTFGGELDAADKIRTLLLNAPMPTLVFVNNNAASAGALISIACDSIYMSPGASIGAASVVNQNGEIMPDKYQSYTARARPPPARRCWQAPASTPTRLWSRNLPGLTSSSTSWSTRQ